MSMKFIFMLEFDTVCLDYTTFILYSHMFHKFYEIPIKTLIPMECFQFGMFPKNPQHGFPLKKKKNSGPLKHIKSFH